MTATHNVVVNVSISADEYVKAYQGVGRTVLVSDAHGRRIRFPASILRPFVTREGIRGVFQIEFEAHGKFRRISRVR